MQKEDEVYMTLQQKFSKTLRDAREQLGLTSEQVAEAVSIPAREYQLIESGHILPDTVSAMRLLLFLEIDIKQFDEALGISKPNRLQ